MSYVDVVLKSVRNDRSVPNAVVAGCNTLECWLQRSDYWRQMLISDRGSRRLTNQSSSCTRHSATEEDVEYTVSGPASVWTPRLGLSEITPRYLRQFTGVDLG